MRRLASFLAMVVFLPCWSQTVIELTEYNAEPVVDKSPSVRVALLVMKMSPEISSKWGLDGGPAVEPKSTPLGRDVPRLLSASDAGKLINALRKQSGSEIIGSKSLVVQSGQEAFGAQSREETFPDLNREPSFKGPEGDVFIPHAIVEGGRDPLGLSLTAIAQVADDHRTINLDVHPRIIVALKTAERDPRAVFSSLELRTQVTIPNGWTMIVMCGYPSLKGDYIQESKHAILDRRPYIVFLTASIVEKAKGEVEE